MTIVLAYVPTPQGEAALTAAIQESHRRDENLLVLNGTRGDALVDPRFAQPDHVKTLTSHLDQCGVSYDWRQEVGEDPVESVLGVVDEINASLLVIGLRRRSPTGKLFLGSRGQQLLLHAACPVLAVKAH